MQREEEEDKRRNQTHAQKIQNEYIPKPRKWNTKHKFKKENRNLAKTK